MTACFSCSSANTTHERMVREMTNHVNKGPQRSSMNQFGHDKNSAHEKSEKMERYHKAYKQKQKEE